MAKTEIRKMTCMSCGHQYELHALPQNAWSAPEHHEVVADPTPKKSWLLRILHPLGFRTI